VSSLLFKIPLDTMLPHLAIGMVLWIFMTSFITEGVTIFSANVHFFLNQKMPFSVVVFALIYKALITLVHNAITVICVFLWFRVSINFNILLFIPALLLTIITGFYTAYIVGMLCARFRDFQHILTNVITIAFYITPVFWKENIIPEGSRWVMHYNPFSHFLLILREPLLGRVPPFENWLICLGITALLAIIGSYVINKYRNNLIYWL
jgi:ABC-2 type transport system permease protein/lipopolysaccharide transport system permease protein